MVDEQLRERERHAEVDDVRASQKDELIAIGVRHENRESTRVVGDAARENRISVDLRERAATEVSAQESELDVRALDKPVGGAGLGAIDQLAKKVQRRDVMGLRNGTKTSRNVDGKNH